jgi:hypothetical protein
MYRRGANWTVCATQAQVLIFFKYSTHTIENRWIGKHLPTRETFCVLSAAERQKINLEIWM